MAKKPYKVRRMRSGEIRIDFTGTPKQNLAAFSALTKALGGKGLEAESTDGKGAASRGEG